MQTSSSAKALQLAAAVLLVISATLILWSGWVSSAQACPPGALGSAGAPSCSEFTDDLAALVVALGFLLIGSAAWLSTRRVLALSYFLLIADALAVGTLTDIRVFDPGARQLFYLLLAWLGALTYRFHDSILDRPAGPARRALIWLLHGISGVESVLLLLWTAGVLQEQPWFGLLRTGIRLNLVLALVLGWVVLAYQYRRGSSTASRGRIRLITFGTLLAFAPFVLLSLLPDTLGAPGRVPYELTFPCLLLSPLAYLYSLFRGQLVNVEVRLNRAAVYYVLITLLLGVYLIADIFANGVIPDSFSGGPLLNAVLSVGLLLLFVPLRQRIQSLINWVLYGGESSYTVVVARLAESLSQTLDRHTLRRLLLDELAPSMRVATSSLFIMEQGNGLVFVGKTDAGPNGLRDCRLAADGPLVAYLERRRAPVTDSDVRQALGQVPLSPDELSILSTTGSSMWVPLLSGGILQGLLLLGAKSEGDYFTAEDKQILRTVVHQAGIAAYNVCLIEEVQASRRELAQAHRQFLAGHEHEQHRLAHELHDGVVQHLLGISYRVAESRKRVSDGASPLASYTPIALAPTLDELRREILSVVTQIRRLIGELRPAGLGELGLIAALEGYAARLQPDEVEQAPAVYLDLDERAAWLPDGTAMCLYRVTQEALRNAVKHANARHIWLALHHWNREVELTVTDDGCGFRVPTRLSELTNDGHFGLLTMYERVAWAGGQFTIRSQSGSGTQVTVRLPLEYVEKGNGEPHTSIACR